MTNNDNGLDRFRQDVEYFEGNYDELVRQYPKQWVAIFNQNVVGTSSELEDLLDDLETNQLPIGEVFIEYANPEEEVLILIGG